MYVCREAITAAQTQAHICPNITQRLSGNGQWTLYTVATFDKHGGKTSDWDTDRYSITLLALVRWCQCRPDNRNQFGALLRALLCIFTRKEKRRVWESRKQGCFVVYWTHFPCDTLWNGKIIKPRRQNEEAKRRREREKGKQQAGATELPDMEIGNHYTLFRQSIVKVRMKGKLPEIETAIRYHWTLSTSTTITDC